MRSSARFTASILIVLPLILMAAGSPPRPAAAQPPAGKPRPAARLEPVFADPKYQLTGVAVSARGRVFTNYPVWSPVHRDCVVEIVAGQARPYPDEAMNRWKPGDDGTRKWVSVQAVYVDDQDKLWVVDPAAPGFGEVYQDSNKLVRIDLATNKIERSYFFPGVADKHSYLNDVRVDTARQVAYLTSSSQGGIVVVDLAAGQARMVLADTPFVRSDPAYHFTIAGREVAVGGAPLKVNSDGIALSPDRAWLYWKPLTDDRLYRIRTADLRDPRLAAAELARRVEDLGHFLVTDGMEFDPHGNLYFGDLEHGAIVKLAPDLKTRTELVKDDRLIWPDSYAISRDGYLYLSTSQAHLAPPFNGGVDKRTLPYGLFRVKLD
jgi:sugar lactone lactonase YvrE